MVSSFHCSHAGLFVNRSLARPERAAWLLRAFLSRLLFRQSQLGGGMAACRSSLLVNRSQADRGMPANVFIITLLTCSLVRKSQLESPWLQERKAESSAQKRLRERLEQAAEKRGGQGHRPESQDR